MSEESSERDPLSVRQIKRKALNPPSEDVSVAKFSRKGILEYRASIIPIRQKSQEEIDKQVLTVSSAALGLSLTFYKDVLSKQIAIFGWLLLGLAQ